MMTRHRRLTAIVLASAWILGLAAQYATAAHLVASHPEEIGHAVKHGHPGYLHHDAKHARGHAHGSDARHRHDGAHHGEVPPHGSHAHDDADDAGHHHHQLTPAVPGVPVVAKSVPRLETPAIDLPLRLHLPPVAVEHAPIGLRARTGPPPKRTTAILLL